MGVGRRISAGDGMSGRDALAARWAAAIISLFIGGTMLGVWVASV